MESIKELRVKLQTDVLGHPILQRVLSIYLTRLFLMTNISANQVTILMVFVGVLAAIPLFFGYIWTGLFLSYLCIVLDASDGEVARYRRTHSLRGIYLDLVNHLMTQALFFLALGFAVAQSQSGWMQTAVLVAAAIGALSFPLRRANGDLHRELFVHHYSAHPERFSLPAISDTAVGESDYESPTYRISCTPLRLIKEAVHYSEYHAVMLVIIVATLVAELVFLPETSSHPILSWLIILYASLSCVYLAKEVIAGYAHMESRVASVARRLGPRHQEDFS